MSWLRSLVEETEHLKETFTVSLLNSLALSILRISIVKQIDFEFNLFNQVDCHEKEIWFLMVVLCHYQNALCEIWRKKITIRRFIWRTKVCCNVDCLKSCSWFDVIIFSAEASSENQQKSVSFDQVCRAECLELASEGQSLIKNHYAVDCIAPKCSELHQISSELTDAFKKRMEFLDQVQELLTSIDDVNCFSFTF